MLLFVGVVGLGVLTVQAATGPNDFCQDYWSAVAVLHGQAVYPPIYCWAGYMHLPVAVEYNSHPPTSILLYAPFGLLPKIPATMLWGFLSLAAYLASGWLLLRSLHWPTLQGLAIFAVGSLFWQPAVQAIQVLNMGQVLLLLLVVVWLLDRQQRNAWAGVVLGMAGLLKIWPLVILVIPLLQRRWRLVAAAGCVVLLGSLAAFIVEGPSAFLAYAGPIRINEQDWITHAGNESVAGTVAGLFTGFRGAVFPPVALVPGIPQNTAILLGELLGAVLMGGGVWLLFWKRRLLQDETGKLIAWGFVVTLILLAFPLTWPWGTITELLPITTLALALRRLPCPSLWWRVLIGASLLFLSVPYTPQLIIILSQSSFRYHQSGLAALGILEVVCPTLGLLLFAGAQAWLLARQEYHEPTAGEPEMW